jgi:hypothetical protein
LKIGEELIYQEASPMRGFMSTVDNRIHVGLGKRSSVDTVWVEWPDSKVSILTHVTANQLVNLYQKESSDRKKRDGEKVIKPFFHVTSELKGIDFTHIENDFVDFDNDRLLFNMISNEGPCMCTGDVNADGSLIFTSEDPRTSRVHSLCNKTQEILQEQMLRYLKRTRIQRIRIVHFLMPMEMVNRTCMSQVEDMNFHQALLL